MDGTSMSCSCWNENYMPDLVQLIKDAYAMGMPMVD